MSFAAMCAIASSKHNAALTCGDPEYGFVALALKASRGNSLAGSNPVASAQVRVGFWAIREPPLTRLWAKLSTGAHGGADNWADWVTGKRDQTVSSVGIPGSSHNTELPSSE